MKLLAINGKTHSLHLGNQYKLKNEDACKSKIQYECGQLIQNNFPTETVLEEVYIPFEALYLDFFLPRLKIVFEVQGRQHYEYNSFFHKNKANFNNAKLRDFRKEKWCAINGIKLYTIDSVEQLKEILGGNRE